MIKIKSLKEFYKKRRSRNREPYCEWTGLILKTNHVCYNCRFSCKRYNNLNRLSSGNGLTCPSCHKDQLFNVGLTARPPKKTASDKIWNEFWKMFRNGSHPAGCR